MPAPTLSPASETPDAALTVDAAVDSATSILVLSDGGGSDDTKTGSAPVHVPGTSPLCNVAAGSGCDPDRPACVFNATDAGPEAGETCTQGASCEAEDGGPPVAMAACRVVQGSPAPSCSVAFAGDGTGKCTISSDCAIGYDCVGALGTALGTCRHYCCDGASTCATLGANWFCDIEPVFHGITSVPVCAYGDACKPLADDCTKAETCTLVDETTAETGCVVPGTAAAGEACLKEKCGADLACIGGMCRQLCKLTDDGGSDSCPSDQTCVASSLFGAYVDVGLCGTADLP